MLGAALAFARHGHAVLPLTWPIKVNGRLVCSCRKAADCTSPAKHPLGRLAPNGLLRASTDEAVIRKWFADEPQANLGVVTDKLIVLDIDPRHDGDSSLAALERDHDFPTTWRVMTGGGGEHVIFACPEGVGDQFQHGAEQPAARSRHRYQGARRLHRRGAVAASVGPRLCLDRRSPSRRYSDRRGAGVAGRGADRRQAAWQHRPPRRRAMGHREGRSRHRISRHGGRQRRRQAVARRSRSIPPSSRPWSTTGTPAIARPPLPERAVADILDRIANREIARLENSHA